MAKADNKKAKTIKVEVLENLRGKKVYKHGEIYELEEDFATGLIEKGLAKKAK